MNPDKRKLVIVTGASSGIGRETALALAAQGHGLVLAARRSSLLESVKGECASAGATAVTVQVCDVGLEPDVLRLAQAVDAAASDGYGETVLVNNAGSAVFGPFHEQPWSASAGQVTAGLVGAMLVTRAVLPRMLVQGGGAVVFVGSVATRNSFAGAEAYSATKHGLLGFARSLSESYRQQGLRVTTVTAGATDTPLWADPSPPKDGMLRSRAVAEAIAWVVAQPADRVYDELVVTPPLGVL